jgi:hypothetical protein
VIDVRANRRYLAAELTLLTAVVALGAAALAHDAGYFGWSWDALNHHVYLGLMAESSRLGQDVVAASFQSYQYPYLYWPVYRLSLLSGDGASVAAGWAAFQAALLLPPVWFLSLRLLPAEAGSPRWWAAAERTAACALAFTSVVVLTGLETTANDLLAAVPLVWAFAAMAVEPSTHRSAAAAAALWGVSAACKLSNAVFLPLLLVWWAASPRAGRGRRGAVMAIAATVGFGLAYLPWGLQLWRLTGNPFYPYFRTLFGPVGYGG